MEDKPLLEDDGIRPRHPDATQGEERPTLKSNPSYDQLPCPVVGYYGDNYKSIKTPRPRLGSNGWQSDSKSSDAEFNEGRRHRPLFIYLVSIINVVLLIYSCASGGIEKVSFISELQKKAFPKFGYIKAGVTPQLNESVSFYAGANFYIGPNATFFVQIGAMYSPCVRPDKAINMNINKQVNQEKNYSCCALNGECGMMSSCPTFGHVIGGISNCSSSQPGCGQGVTVRPCCVGLHAKCIIVSQDQCMFLRGYWHSDKVLCSEVVCLDDICGMTGVKRKDGGDQGYRLMTAVFIHLGVLHLLVNLLFQIPIGRMIEIKIGTLRTALIYLVSGLGGNLVNGIFSPLTPQVGASGALFGLVGMILIHFIHYYRALQRPFRDLCALIAIIVFSFGLGTLPYIGNFVHLGGFIFGVLVTLVLVRRVSFGWIYGTRYRYCCVKVVASLMLISLLIACFVGLYLTKNSDFCTYCHVINCIPWTEKFCPKMTSDGILN